MIHHPIVLGTKVALLLVIVIVLVILHGILPEEQFKVAVKIGIGAFIVGVLVIWGVFFAMLSNPNSRLSRQMVLTDASGADGKGDERGQEAAKLAELVGVEGVAETNLRPSGIGRFGDELVDVVSDRTFIEKDQRIVVIGIEGKKVRVRPA